MSRVGREFIFSNARKVCTCGRCLVALLLLPLLLFSASDLLSQWRRVLLCGPPYPYRATNIQIAAAVRDVKFNKWGIGFANISPGPKNPNGGIWKSTDSGMSWHEVNVNVINSRFPQIYSDDITFKDSLTGWLTAPSGYDPITGGTHIYKTSDGGMNWSCVFSDTYTYTTRAIYYSPLISQLFASVWPAGGPIANGVIVSTDEGTSWAYAIGPNIGGFGTNGICTMDSVIVVATVSDGSGKQCRSTDAGLTWNASYPLPYPYGVECWQPYADTTRNLFYLVNDGNPDAGSSAGFYRSTDQALTWKEVSAFNFYFYLDGDYLSEHGAVNGCIAGDTAGNVYIQKVTEGMWRSTDSGSSWTSICGPSNKWDTRFCVFNNTLFAGGEDGIWALDLSQPRRILLDTALIIMGSACDRVSKPFYFTSSYPCAGSVMLDSVSIDGSMSFKARSESYQQGGITGRDSIIVEYTPGNSFDTAHLTFHFVENGIRHDTTVTLYGFAGPPVSISLYLKSQVLTTHAGDTIEIPIYLSGNDTILGKTIVNVSLSLDADMIEPIEFIPALPDISLVGPLLYSNGVETLLFEVNGLKLQGETIIGKLRCVVYLSERLQTSISLERVNISSDDPRCLAPTTKPVDIFVNVNDCGDSVISAFLRSDALPLRIVSLRPNPAQNELAIELDAAEGGAVNLKIYDELGRKVFSADESVVKGKQTIVLPLRGFSDGIYNVRAGAISARFVKVQ